MRSIGKQVLPAADRHIDSTRITDS